MVQNDGPEELISQVLPLKSIVAYQKGSIVSRMIINKHGGTVTAFAFGEGEGLSEHTAPYDAMIIALDGRVEVILGGEPHYLSEGDMLIMPANVPHALNPLTPFKMLLVMIHAA